MLLSKIHSSNMRIQGCHIWIELISYCPFCNLRDLYFFMHHIYILLNIWNDAGSFWYHVNEINVNENHMILIYVRIKVCWWPLWPTKYNLPYVKRMWWLCKCYFSLELIALPDGVIVHLDRDKSFSNINISWWLSSMGYQLENHIKTISINIFVK